MSASPQVMNDQTLYFYAHPLQKRRFFLALIFATLLFPLIAAALIAGTLALIVPLVALLLWIGMRVFFARLTGNCIQVSEVNYPRIHAIAEELKVKMGYPKPVYIFVLEQGSFNAYLSLLFFRRAIFLTSEILEAGVSDDEVRWLVGRFIGYMRARRQAGVLGWIIRAAQKLVVFNIFMLPYERAMVYTGDRLALAGIGGDISCATSAMQKLLVGRQLGYSVNPEGIIAQQRQITGTFFGFLARIASGFPHSITRYVDLIQFTKGYFPAQFARFAATNPGLPEDFSPLLTGPRPVAVAPQQEDGYSDSGMRIGWALVAVVLLTLSGGYEFWRGVSNARETRARQAMADSLQAADADAPVAEDAAGASADESTQQTPRQAADAAVAQDAAGASADESTEQTPSAQIPEHSHVDAAGQLTPDAGCKWVSADPKDYRVICGQMSAASGQ